MLGIHILLRHPKYHQFWTTLKGADHDDGARAELERQLDVVQMRFTRQDDHRHVSRSDDFSENIDAADVRQVEIEDHQINRLRLDEGIDRGAAIQRADNFISIERPEQKPKSTLRDPMIVDYQDIVL